jgi:hypothetical protein
MIVPLLDLPHHPANPAQNTGRMMFDKIIEGANTVCQAMPAIGRLRRRR